VASTSDRAIAPTPQQRLLRLLRLERNDLGIALLFSLAIGLLTLVVPVATQSVVNTVAFGSLLQPLVILGLLVLVLLALSSLLQVLRFHVVETLQRRIFVRVSSASINGLLRARAQLPKGPAVVNYFLEVVTLQKAGATLLVDGLSVVMQTLSGMTLLALYHPWLLAFDALLLISLLIVIVPLGFGAVHSAVQESKAKHDLVAWLEEIARNPTTFRGGAEQSWAFARGNDLASNYLNNRATHFRILLRQFSGSLALQAIASAGLLGLGGMLVIQRQLTVGQLVAAELVVSAVLSGIAKLAKHLESLYDLLASLDKLGALSDIPAEESGEEPLSAIDQAVRLRVRAPRFSLAVEPSDRLAVTGLSGSGKSSFLDTICGYSSPPGWGVEVDGIDIRHVERTSLRSQLALVRGTEIFAGTILDNVRVGREDISVAEVQVALGQTGIWEAIQNLPNGLHTELAGNGLPLSEGQAQALMLARAIVRKPRLLIIDETLDHIEDLGTRELLADLLFDMRAPWTLVVVTTRQDLLRRCGRVLKLPEGTLGHATEI